MGHTLISNYGKMSEGIFSIIKKLVLMKMGIGNLFGLGYSSQGREYLLCNQRYQKMMKFLND
ncbi:MAG: hypothetical protein DWB56_12290 [Candidatus Jettenia sp.]|nr:MAG: hypothetical protein EDM77_16560 [Candidatus Jettenia sp. AMX1]MBC6929715.1 hypothetical protein [Candidatus Jettenia sp.]MCE7881239.1 hypothetical protein [Candidatus Jettenia sp. AMX1]MCQ3928080.1 hypothetical protein [Candidatus Jettenia sp.]